MKNMNQLMKQAQKMQAQVMAAQKELAETDFTGQAAGDMISITINGAMDLQSVKIKPEVLEDIDVDELEDMIVAAFRAAQEAAREASDAKLGPLTGGMGLPGM
ncbi:MAG: YbaB/EbfC family nucleoid-associated protein [bacterium]|nr:YbaB/EbfC family nucleoid-associated protein [bacterium]